MYSDDRFDTLSNEKQFLVTFNDAMFLKPNQKCFDVMVHFLLEQLDAERAHRIYGKNWPFVPKELQKELKDAVFAWLSELASPKQHQQHQQHAGAGKVMSESHANLLHSVRFPLITKSLLSNPGGMKACEFVFALSQFVMLWRLIALSKWSIRNLMPSKSLIKLMFGASIG